jgi:hypothetical protein
MKKVLFALAAVSLFAFTTGNDHMRIVVEHIPPGNVENTTDIDLPINALSAHIQHGDNIVVSSAGEAEQMKKFLEKYNIELLPTTSIIIK